ncbi:hypothetical protein M426DRAFT_323744 [Hypoxylon sp. CI-4A]|nr:hypothetical protein M426DRAFT_323744 [Hypoxylon sp. CI-4A]
MSERILSVYIASMYAWSDPASITFGTLCISTALPFAGIPFPDLAWVNYYADKNRWLPQLSGGRLTPKHAGYVGATLRLVVGYCCICPPTRVAALLLNGVVISCGTIVAYLDGRPMRPQWNMLGAVEFCLALDILKGA